MRELVQHRLQLSERVHQCGHVLDSRGTERELEVLVPFGIANSFPNVVKHKPTKSRYPRSVARHLGDELVFPQVAEGSVYRCHVQPMTNADRWMR